MLYFQQSSIFFEVNRIAVSHIDHILTISVAFYLFLIFQVIFFYDFPFVRRSSFSNSFFFFLIWECLYFAFIHKEYFLWIWNSCNTVVFFQHFRNVPLLSSWLHDFSWEMHSHLNFCSSVSNTQFYPGCCLCFSFVFSFQKFDYAMFGIDFFLFILFCFFLRLLNL